jgi:hypothetical protein
LNKFFCLNLHSNYTKYILRERYIKNIDKNLNDGYITSLKESLLNRKNICDKIHSSEKKSYVSMTIHSVWVSIKEKNLDYFKKNSSKDLFFSNLNILNKCSFNWKYILWTNGIELIPASNIFIKNVGMRVYNISSILNYSSKISINYMLDSASKFKNTSVANTILTMSSDIIRYSVLQKEGGVYLDIDYVLNKNPNFLINKADFIIGMFRIAHPYLLSSSFVSTKPNHPTVSQALDGINDNINLMSTNNYFHSILDYGILNKQNLVLDKIYVEKHEMLYNCNMAFAVDFISGPAAISKAFYDKININNRIDLAVGYEALHHFSDYSTNNMLQIPSSLNLDHLSLFDNIGQDIELTGWYKVYFESPVVYQYDL